MRELIINIPESVQIDARELSMTLACSLYEEGKLSLGQAAELAGYSKRTFTELLGTYNVSLFNYSASELENEVRNA